MTPTVDLERHVTQTVDVRRHMTLTVGGEWPAISSVGEGQREDNRQGHNHQSERNEVVLGKGHQLPQ